MASFNQAGRAVHNKAAMTSRTRSRISGNVGSGSPRRRRSSCRKLNVIAARTAQKEATEKFFEQAKAATAQAGATSLTDYPAADETGYPNFPSKYSFRKLVEGLSAEEYARRLKDDRQFSAALDRLNDGNN